MSLNKRIRGMTVGGARTNGFAGLLIPHETRRGGKRVGTDVAGHL